MGDESHHDFTGFEALSIVRMSMSGKLGSMMIGSLCWLSSTYTMGVFGMYRLPSRERNTYPTKREKGQRHRLFQVTAGR